MHDMKIYSFSILLLFYVLKCSFSEEVGSISTDSTSLPDVPDRAPVEPGSFYSSFCSKIEATYTRVDLNQWDRGTLVSSPEDCVLKPSGCKWLLAFASIHSSTTSSTDNEANETSTTLKPTRPPDVFMLKISFDHFEIAPLYETNQCSNFTAANQNSTEDDNSTPAVEYFEDYEEYPPCYFNHLNLSYFDESTGQRLELIGQFCGDGWVEPIQTQIGRSVLVEVSMTRPFAKFKLGFKKVRISPTATTIKAESDSEEACMPSHFLCPGENKCIPEAYRCDANVDCRFGGDEDSVCQADDQLRGKQLAKAAKSTDSGCGTERYQKGINGVFSSENYPQYYPNDARCIWYITTAPGTKILVSFNQLFAIEAGGQSAQAEECPFDSLTFYAHHDDNDDETDVRLTFLGRRCGQTAPKAFITPSNSILVIFETDAANTGPGFRLFWQAISAERAAALTGVKPTKPPSLGVTSKPVAKYTQQACGNPTGVVLTNKYGTIRSPFFGQSPYPRNLSCLWTIKPDLPAGQVIKSVDIRFYDFNIQPSERCAKDAVEVVFYDKQNRRRRGKYCDSNRPLVGEGLVAETKGEVQIIFRSDSETGARGFELGFNVASQSVEEAEGGTALPKAFYRPKQADKAWSMIETCGETPFRPPAYSEQLDRVVGGRLSQPGSWPFAAELLYHGHHYCGATILNEYWLVTAAHCFRNGRRHVRGWQVVIGRHNVRSQVAWDQSSTILQPAIDKILVHHSNGRTQNPKAFDIALIKLRRKLDLQRSVAKAACLPSRDIKTTDRCYVVGWGTTQRTGAEGFLNQAYLPVIDNESCRRMNFYYQSLVDDKMLCAGYQRGGIDSCQGDSGGPLACYVKGRWELHGVVSFGKGCAGANAPGVYTRLWSFNDWIRKVVEAFETKESED